MKILNFILIVLILIISIPLSVIIGSYKELKLTIDEFIKEIKYIMEG